MTRVFIKAKNKRTVEKSVSASPRPKAAPEMHKVVKELIKERKKLVPNKGKRLAVISLANFKSITFDEALQIVNKAKEGFKVSKEKEKLIMKERRRMARRKRKKSPKFLKSNSTVNQTKNKLWVRIFSGGGGPGTGKKR